MEIIDLFFGMRYKNDCITPGYCPSNSQKKGPHRAYEYRKTLFYPENKVILKALILMDRRHTYSLEQGILLHNKYCYIL